MPRTNAAAVRGIIDVDDALIEDDSDLDPFIEAANAVVTGVCTNVSYTNTMLELIERWLAAHFYCIEDPRRFIEQIDTLQDYYESKVDLHLNNTRYGQQAIVVDTIGSLAMYNNALKKATATLPAQAAARTLKVGWLGKSC